MSARTPESIVKALREMGDFLVRDDQLRWVDDVDAAADLIESLRRELAAAKTWSEATAAELRKVQDERTELKRRNAVLYELSNRVRDQAVEAESKLETAMIMLGDGKSFRCTCGCNVFTHETEGSDQTLYVCNACGEQYEGS